MCTTFAMQMSRQEVLASIKDDYRANYFVQGSGDMSAYDPDCLFTDPFSGFRGTERFKNNIGNFGNFLEDVQLDVLDFTELDDGLRTRWRFAATLKFPWRPRLAAAGRTTHFFNEVGLLLPSGPTTFKRKLPLLLAKLLLDGCYWQWY